MNYVMLRNSAVLTVFAVLFINISNIYSKESKSKSVYVRYVRRLPPWFPSDKYVEEVVEEFETINEPPEFGSSEDYIQRFIEADQTAGERKNKTVLEQYKTVNFSSYEQDPRKPFKATITTTIHRPVLPEVEFRAADRFLNVESATTVAPYTIVLMESGESDYYDTFEEITSSNLTTKASIRTTTAQSPTTTSSRFSWFRPALTTASTSITPTTQEPSSTTSSVGLNWFGHTSSSTTPTTQSPTTPMSRFSWFRPTSPSSSTSTLSATEASLLTTTPSSFNWLRSTLTASTPAVSTTQKASSITSSSQFNWFGSGSSNTTTTTEASPTTSTSAGFNWFRPVSTTTPYSTTESFRFSWFGNTPTTIPTTSTTPIQVPSFVESSNSSENGTISSGNSFNSTTSNISSTTDPAEIAKTGSIINSVVEETENFSSTALYPDEESNIDESVESIEGEATITDIEEDATIRTLEDDYVNGELTDSVEEETYTTTETTSIITTTVKAGLFPTWFG